ncbi:MAG TPA: DUF5678 domain-containing protein [Anaerolineae bacterium]
MEAYKVSLRPDLVSQVKRITQRENADVEEFVDQAVRERIKRLKDEKFEAEAEAYRQLHPELVKQYLGQFVAIHEGQVVDHGPDSEELFLRIKRRYGDIPVYFQLVNESGIMELRAPSPRLEWNLPK